MNVSCTHCQAVFRVDPEKIPAAGVRVRCSTCSGVFPLTRASAATPSRELAGVGAGGAAPSAGVSAPPPAPAAAVRPAPPTPAQPVAAPVAPAAPLRPAAAAPPAPTAAAPAPPPAAAAPAAAAPKAAPAAAAATTPPPSTAAPAGAAAPRPGASPFGAQDPNARAQRLARALVSDIIAYHPDRREKSLQAGTLRTEFRDEIMKSWDEYVAQVGQEIAKSTPYFRNALNEILAKGQKLF